MFRDGEGWVEAWWRGRVGVAFGVVIGFVGGWGWEYGWGEGGLREKMRQQYP